MQIELAETLTNLGDVSGAITAWDAAAQLVEGRLRPVLVPIRLLAENSQSGEALARAKGLWSQAQTAEQFHVASLAYKYAGDKKRAVMSARLALERRTGDGRLRAELASRLEEAGQTRAATAILRDLLVCGARGRPWHRHEIAARLVGIVGKEGIRTEIAQTTCQPADSEELSQMIFPDL